MTDLPTDARPPSIAVPQVACGTCRFWVKLNEQEGECRLNPPQVVVTHVRTPLGEGNMPVPMFPRVRPEIWCGQYKSRLLGATLP